MDYFAYGINLNKAHMLQVCPGAKAKFKAILPNYRIVFSGWSRDLKSSTINLKPFRGDKVTGGVWAIPENQMQRLDRFEDYPMTYERINVLIINEDGEAGKAFTYIKKRPADEAKPSTEYLAVIRQGYKDWGIE